MNVDLFGQPTERRIEVLAFHDESGADPHKDRFLLQGVLFIPCDYFQKAVETLILARDGYKGRIHFADLRDRSSSKRTAVARSWMDKYFRFLSEKCPFKCMIVDRYSKHEAVRRYKLESHLYNFSTYLAIHGGIAWSYSGYDRLRLRIYSEERSRKGEDNFHTYVPNKVFKKLSEKRSRGGKTPLIEEPPEPIIEIPGDPARSTPVKARHCEMIQLTDLLTSAVAQALNATAKQVVKLDLGAVMAGWIDDTRLPPWVQKLDLHRKFSISCFPDSYGNFYDVQLEIENQDQLSCL